MRCEIETEMEIPMCIDDICTPMEVPISSEFMLKNIEINATDSPLSHLCSIAISFGSEMVYEGPIGEHGFVMQITELEPRGDYALKFSANCSKLHSLIGEPIEPVRLVIRGYEEIEDEINFGHDFSLEWS
jgi:hypothetical protein|tara:strand:- start:7244 stop:7633 length:390 start_codon:yes stop_codon:yes gene_type:complete